MWTLNRTRSLVKTDQPLSRRTNKSQRVFRPAPDRLETREVLSTFTGLAAGSPALAFVNPLLNLSRNTSAFSTAGANNGLAGGTILNFNRAFTTPGGSNNVNPNLLANGGRLVNNGLTNGFSQAQFRNSNPGGLSNGFGATSGLAFNNGLGGVGFSSGNNGFGATTGLSFNNGLGGTNFGSSPNRFGAGSAAGLANNNGLGGVFIGSPGNGVGTANGLGGTNIGTSGNGFGAASGLAFNNGIGGFNNAVNNPFSQFASSNRFSTGNGLSTFNSGGFTGLRF